MELTTNGHNTVLDEELAQLLFVTTFQSHQCDFHTTFDQVLPLCQVIE
jgi:hypothetical protein